ncbi:MAG: hypothetical protein ACW9W3_04650 [Candidatus Nitrosopumilus sp. bin_68KS]
MTDELDENTINRLILQNTCENCGNKFKPINSMTFEKLCSSCSKIKSK